MITGYQIVVVKTKNFPKTIKPVQHEIIKTCSDGTAIEIEHVFEYIDEEGIYHVESFKNKDVRFIKAKY